MANSKRVFVLGAGFSKPAGMPLANQLLPLLQERLKHREMQVWLESVRDRVMWLKGQASQADSFKLNIEELFHYAHFDIEVHRLMQHFASVGRGDGPGTPWNQSEAVQAWLSHLEDALRDVIAERDRDSDLTSIRRWARTVGATDAVVTFNYDTLAERSLAAEGRRWSHGTGREDDEGVSVYKLHGSIDWIVADRSQEFSELDLLFDKENSNRADGRTGHVEDDCRLWRCRTQSQMKKWIDGRDLQWLDEGACPSTVGIAGLGAYKQLHRIPGLGRVWTYAMRAVHEADLVVVVGFSMSDFDAMAQMQFAESARLRHAHSHPLRVIVIDPYVNEAGKNRFRRVFGTKVELVNEEHQNVDWTGFT